MVATLVYTSTAVQELDRRELLDLLGHSRSHNAAAGVTGILLYRDSNFLQLLEGEETTVRDLYATISRDPRHRDVRPVWVASSGGRRFSEWSMGFRNLAEEPVDDPAFVDLLRLRSDADELLLDPDRLDELLDLLQPVG